MIIFVVYQCLSIKFVQTKQTQLVRAFFTKVSTVTPNYEKIKKGGIVRGCSTLRNPVCCLFFLCVPFLKDSLFLISSGKQERAELHAALRTEIMGKSTCLDYFQVTLFSKLVLNKTIHFVATSGISFFLMAE